MFWIPDTARITLYLVKIKRSFALWSWTLCFFPREKSVSQRQGCSINTSSGLMHLFSPIWHVKFRTCWPGPGSTLLNQVVTGWRYYWPCTSELDLAVHMFLAGLWCWQRCEPSWVQLSGSLNHYWVPWKPTYSHKTNKYMQAQRRNRPSILHPGHSQGVISTWGRGQCQQRRKMQPQVGEWYST